MNELRMLYDFFYVDICNKYFKAVYIIKNILIIVIKL